MHTTCTNFTPLAPNLHHLHQLYTGCTECALAATLASPYRRTGPHREQSREYLRRQALLRLPLRGAGGGGGRQAVQRSSRTTSSGSGQKPMGFRPAATSRPRRIAHISSSHSRAFICRAATSAAHVHAVVLLLELQQPLPLDVEPLRPVYDAAVRQRGKVFAYRGGGTRAKCTPLAPTIHRLHRVRTASSPRRCAPSRCDSLPPFQVFHGQAHHPARFAASRRSSFRTLCASAFVGFF